MSEKTSGKGRPTPKRRDAQNRRTGPVAPPPTNRREAARQLREKQAEERRRIREGTMRGDEAAFLPRDRGPVRRLVRDLVDSRRSLGWLLLPMALLVVVVGFTGNVRLQALTFALWLATLAAAAFDMALAGISLRRRVKEAFPDERKVGSHVRYGLLRTTVIRRFRTPRPQVERGQQV